MMSRIYIAICQHIAAKVFWIISQLRGGITVTNNATIERSTPYLFISNHQSRIDTFVEFSAMSFIQLSNVVPMKTMTKSAIYYSVFRPFLASWGCYPTRVPGKDIIEYSAALMGKGYNLFIFPEGRRTFQKDSDPRDGVCRLIKQTAQYSPELVLIHIEWKHLGRFRRHATVTLANAPKDLDLNNPRAIMNAIYSI